MINEKQYMTMALELAKTAIGYTSPNPNVGAVIVKDGKIVGTGAHLKAGDSHAEIHALRMAGENARGATLYISLEPCNHYGKTPPCTLALIKSGIRRVVIATLDQNPRVSGQGKLALEQAGIIVEVGLLEDEAKELNKIFFHYITTHTPYITLKCGMSIDAKLATKSFESQWITNEKSRSDAHNYRLSHDAILVGVNTVLADNPSLTYRGKKAKQLIRIILDTHLKTPLNTKIITDTTNPTWIIVGNQVRPDKIAQYNMVKIIQMPDKEINLEKLMIHLGELGITSILVEGGYRVLTSFIEQKIFNELVTYIAPILIGGKLAPNLFMGEGFNRLSDTLKLRFKDVSMIDDNLKLILTKQGV